MNLAEAIERLMKFRDAFLSAERAGFSGDARAIVVVLDALGAEKARAEHATRYGEGQRATVLKLDAENAALRVAREQEIEHAKNFGADMMLSQMEKAVQTCGRFSDERANRFVDALKRERERNGEEK